MRRLWLAGLAAAALVAVAVLWPGDTPPTLDETASDLVASGVPGVIVRLRDGDEVRELAKGEASVSDRFRVGSVTKTFVAALTLELADLGLLSLDDTAADFEPRLVSDADEITIRELLSASGRPVRLHLRSGAAARRARSARAGRHRRRQAA